MVIKRPGLEPTKIRVRIWNDTVSNLTLMALGSSAPEILLSIIEVIAKGFEAGDLGPNTIVGSAAFNLFMITAICVMAVPATEVRRQKHLDVFFVTATWFVFISINLWSLNVFFKNIYDYCKCNSIKNLISTKFVVSFKFLTFPISFTPQFKP